MNNYIIVGCAVGLFGFGYGVASYKAEVDFMEYQIEAEHKVNVLRAEIDALNKENQNLVRAMEQEAIERLQEQKEAYEKIIDELRGSVGSDGLLDSSRTCDNVSRSGEDSNCSVCYPEGELRRKIEKSLALAHEADELAVKYATVLKIVEGQNVQK